MSAEAKLEIARKRYVAQQSAAADESFHHWLVRDGAVAGCESPIEKLFMAEALLRGWEFPDQNVYTDCYQAIHKLCDPPSRHRSLVLSSNTAEIVSQVPITIGRRAMRLDFAVRVRRKPGHSDWIAIEIDGHDFHERTREQAARDRSKDRLLQQAGWRVLRFTGSEVYRGAADCWEEVDSMIYEILLERV